MVKIAYCLLVHRNPEQVRRLLERIRNPEDHYYVNVFKARRHAARVPWEAALGTVRGMDLKVAYRYGSGWGNFNLIAATLDAMRFFRNSEYDYFVNLSGQCYPIHPLETFREHLAGSSRTFMDFKPYPSDLRALLARSGTNSGFGGYRKSELERFTHWHYRIVRREFGIVLKIPRLRRHLPYGLVPFRGSQWFFMRRDHVDHLLDYLDRHPAIVRFFRRSSVPDDVFFQTIVMNSPDKEEVTKTSRLRYSVWSRGRPQILTMNDLPQLLSAPEDWARKFDPLVDAAVLDEMDRRIQQPQVS